MYRFIFTIIAIISISVSLSKVNATPKPEDSLPILYWKEGTAVVTGHILNYQPNGDKETPHVYPRCSLGHYADRTHGYSTVDTTGNFRIDVRLYQTHQPCFITVPGYYGLIYVSPGDSISLLYPNRQER